MSTFPTQVYRHSDKDDDAKQVVEHRGEEDDCDDYICHGGEDVENDVGQQAVDGGGPAIHDPQNLPRLAPQVPTEAERVQVREEAHLRSNGCWNLHRHWLHQ